MKMQRARPLMSRTGGRAFPVVSGPFLQEEVEHLATDLQVDPGGTLNVNGGSLTTLGAANIDGALNVGNGGTFIAMLGSFILALHYNSCGYMGDTHRGIGYVNMLTTCAA